jgi:hypothetical protein
MMLLKSSEKRGSRSVQGERHEPDYCELGEVEPVACIPWSANKVAKFIVVTDDVDKAESELFSC